MPHSTFFSTPPPPIPEAKPLPPVANTTTTSLIRTAQPSDDFPASLKSSPLRSPIKPTFTLPPTRKRFFVTTHARSKSESATMTLAPTSVPALFPASSPSPSTPRRRTREYPPPLLRANSLPLVIPEGRKLSLATMPPGPSTPPATHRSSFLGGPRSASPTRIYASSISPAGIRSGYYPGSSFSPRAPSPPSYLVNEPMYPASSSSSSPSTPTSLRSRSPSISSLETIPDTPDAEQAAVEAELKEAMERKAARLENEDEDDSGVTRRRRSVDFDRAIRWGAADKRKRWSVCGGEKRGDLDLETIWEEALSTAEASHIIHRDEEEDEETDESDESDESDNQGDSTEESDDHEHCVEEEEEED